MAADPAWGIPTQSQSISARVLARYDSARIASRPVRRTVARSVSMAWSGTWWWMRTTTRSTVLLGRCAAWLASWVLDTETFAARRDLRADSSPQTVAQWEKLRSRHHATIWARSFALFGAVVLLWSAGAHLAVLPAQVLAAGALAIMTGLGVLAKRRSPDAEGSPVKAKPVGRITQDVVLTALSSLGIAKLTRALEEDHASVRILHPGVERDRRHGAWSVELDLPQTVTALDVIDRRRHLAGAMDRPIECVWPSIGSTERRLRLWVMDEPLYKQPPVDTGIGTAPVDILTDRCPLGANERGETITVSLAGASVLVAGGTGSGKTWTARDLALWCACDPRAEIDVVALKTGVDWPALAPRLGTFIHGSGPEQLQAFDELLTRLRADIDRRGLALAQVGHERCPGGQVTTGLADDPTLGLHPRVLVVDECQLAYAATGQIGKDLARRAEEIVRLARAAGYTVIHATQEPSKDSIPVGLSAQASVRICHAISGVTAGEIVMGNKTYAAGVRPTDLVPRRDAGIAWLVADLPSPTIIRAAAIDGAAAANIATTTAAAAHNHHPATPQLAAVDNADTDLLDDIATIWPTGEPSMWSSDIATALERHNPTHYAGLTQQTLNAQLRNAGITPTKISRNHNGTRANRYGIRHTDLTPAALAV